MKEDEEEKEQSRLLEGDREVEPDSDISDDEDAQPEEELDQRDTRIWASDIPIVWKLKIKDGVTVLETKWAP